MTWVNPFDAVSLGGGAKPIVVTQPVTIGAIPTPPTKPTTPTIDYATVIDDGSGWCSLQMQLSAETNQAGSTAGNGIYLFTLPGGYKFDLFVHPATTMANYAEVTRMIPGSKGFLASGDSTYQDLAAACWDATRFFLFKPHTWEKVASNWYRLGGTYNVSYQMAFMFKKG